MAKIDPIKLILGREVESLKDYHEIDMWATDQGMPDDQVARFSLAFAIAVLVKRGCPETTLVRFVIKNIQLAYEMIEEQEKK